MTSTTIYCSREVRRLWPRPLARQWQALYPRLFDPDDVRLAASQPKNHFCEWFAAIHLFHRDGVLSLVEKYLFRAHLRKTRLVAELLDTERRRLLAAISRRYRVQPPDLLLYRPAHGAIRFAEVKGPRDQVRDPQRRSHEAIEHELSMPVEIVCVQLE
jgi:hypothetical protein